MHAGTATGVVDEQVHELVKAEVRGGQGKQAVPSMLGKLVYLVFVVVCHATYVSTTIIYISRVGYCGVGGYAGYVGYAGYGEVGEYGEGYGTRRVKLVRSSADLNQHFNFLLFIYPSVIIFILLDQIHREILACIFSKY